MQKYKRAVEEVDETKAIHEVVLESWELLVKKGGDTKRYHDALLKDECAYLVERAIADFGVQHRACGQALTDYVIGFLGERFNSSDDGGDPYYPSEDDKLVDWLDGGDESEDEDGDSGEDEDGDDNHSDK